MRVIGGFDPEDDLAEDVQTMIRPFAAAVSLSLLVPAVRALEVDRLYYQVAQPIQVSLPSLDAGATADLVLLRPDNTIVARSSIEPAGGLVDLTQEFADLFDLRTVHYVQLLVDGEATESPLVLQPMTNRPRPTLRMVQRGTQRVPTVEGWQEPSEAEVAMSGFRIYQEPHVVLDTTMGDIRLAMRPDHAPNTVYNFIDLVEGGFYTNIPVHRVVSVTASGFPFVIQAGDPTGTGMGGPGYQIDLEPSTLPHDLGVISMAREGSDVDTGGSQFFICLSRQGTQFLDGQYTAFGETKEGIDVVQKIAEVKTDPRTDRPLELPLVESARLVPAPPRTPAPAPESSEPGDGTP